MDTLTLCEEVRYDSAFTFIYSKRTGTPAAIMEDQIPEDVVKERFNRLLHTIQTIANEECGRFEGKVVDVLVEEYNEEKELLTGRMGHNLLVHFPGCPSMLGKIVPVKLEESKGFYFIGKIAEQEG